MKLMSRAKMLAVGLSCIATLEANAAGLDGAQVVVTAFCCTAPVPSDATSVPVTATVGPSIEFPSGSIVTTGNILISTNIDISSFAIDIAPTEFALSATGSFNGYGFDFSGGDFGRITGVSFAPETNFDLAATEVTFDADSIFFSAPGQFLSPTSLARINVVVGPVPEPATAALMAVGLVLVGLRCRRRSRPDASLPNATLGVAST